MNEREEKRNMLADRQRIIDEMGPEFFRQIDALQEAPSAPVTFTELYQREGDRLLTIPTVRRRMEEDARL